MFVSYYSGIVQHLQNWEKPAPKFVENKPFIEEVIVREEEEIRNIF